MFSNLVNVDRGKDCRASQINILTNSRFFVTGGKFLKVWPNCIFDNFDELTVVNSYYLYYYMCKNT